MIPVVSSLVMPVGEVDSRAHTVERIVVNRTEQIVLRWFRTYPENDVSSTGARPSTPRTTFHSELAKPEAPAQEVLSAWFTVSNTCALTSSDIMSDGCSKVLLQVSGAPTWDEPVQSLDDVHGANSDAQYPPAQWTDRYGVDDCGHVSSAT